MADLMAIHVGDVPVLLRPARHRNAPIIVLYHGFGPPNSPQDMADAFPLEALDANLAYIGLPMFGERLPAGGIDEVMQRQARDYLRQLLIPIVEQAADELAPIVTAITERTGANTKLGLLGFSAGGVVAAANLIRAQAPIQAAILVNTVNSPAAAVALSERLSGTTYPWDNDARAAAHRADLTAHAATVAARRSPPALLILHGADDEYATPDDARTLYHTLANAYLQSGHTDLVKLRVFDDVAHHLTGANQHVEGLSPAGPLNEAATAWLTAHLSKTT
ncbi:alpha/beta hydrolase family protein [Mycobacterium sp. pUA109]|uniref:alpha/beta hydrolase family protein n=1 Tax=Mycobacterium sp. pUA109 TaxID=3238982 RepID=UPI00351AE487